MNATIKIEKVGKNFAFRGVVKQGRKIIGKTGLRGTEGSARVAAIDLVEKAGLRYAF